MTSYSPSTIQDALQFLYTEAVVTLPVTVFAMLLVIVGFFLGGAAKNVIKRLFKRGRIDDVMVATGAHTMVEKTGFTLDTGAFVGTLLKWFIILFFLDMALGVLGLQAATAFLSAIVLGYLPRIFVAAAIVFGAIVLAHVAHRAVVAHAQAMHMHGARSIGHWARILILIGAILAALIQLHIMTEVALILFAGLVLAISIAAGIAFGHGGKEVATRYIDALTRKGD